MESIREKLEKIKADRRLADQKKLAEKIIVWHKWRGVNPIADSVRIDWTGFDYTELKSICTVKARQLLDRFCFNYTLDSIEDYVSEAILRCFEGVEIEKGASMARIARKATSEVFFDSLKRARIEKVSDTVDIMTLPDIEIDSEERAREYLAIHRQTKKEALPD